MSMSLSHFVIAGIQTSFDEMDAAVITEYGFEDGAYDNRWESLLNDDSHLFRINGEDVELRLHYGENDFPPIFGVQISHFHELKEFEPVGLSIIELNELEASITLKIQKLLPKTTFKNKVKIWSIAFFG